MFYEKRGEDTLISKKQLGLLGGTMLLLISNPALAQTSNWPPPTSTETEYLPSVPASNFSAQLAQTLTALSFSVASSSHFLSTSPAYNLIANKPSSSQSRPYTWLEAGKVKTRDVESNHYHTNGSYLRGSFQIIGNRMGSAHIFAGYEDIDTYFQKYELGIGIAGFRSIVQFNSDVAVQRAKLKNNDNKSIDFIKLTSGMHIRPFRKFNLWASAGLLWSSDKDELPLGITNHIGYTWKGGVQYALTPKLGLVLESDNIYSGETYRSFKLGLRANF